jgi:hypothetical protein
MRSVTMITGQKRVGTLPGCPPGSGGVSGDCPTGCMLPKMNTHACRAGRSRRALGGSDSGRAPIGIPASTTGAGDE